jgi:hypothetical protein
MSRNWFLYQTKLSNANASNCCEGRHLQIRHFFLWPCFVDNFKTLQSFLLVSDVQKLTFIYQFNNLKSDIFCVHTLLLISILAVCSDETLATRQSTRRYNPADEHRHLHCRENLKSRCCTLLYIFQNGKFLRCCITDSENVPRKLIKLCSKLYELQRIGFRYFLVFGSNDLV